MATITPARRQATTALLDAAEELLVEVGHAGVTVRALAERAGVNQGLVHYYFGSMDELLLQTLERFTARLIERQRALYAGPEPFVEKWRTAMRHLTDDLESGYQKVWLELQAMAWNHAGMRDRVRQVLYTWVGVLRPAFQDGLAELRIDEERLPADVAVALVATFNQGIILEQLSGADSGHRLLLDWIDEQIASAERRAAGPPRGG
ncbi:MAG: TetR/AcrR family transcriptional regulator [Chloroflexi bacterium]|nr:TetR/AcrR family transcriptional regulator [Chloroflexota bacterium]